MVQVRDGKSATLGLAGNAEIEGRRAPRTIREQYTIRSRYLLPSDFEPGTWDYADDQIPAWYKEWEQTPAEETGKSGRNRNSRRHGAWRFRYELGHTAAIPALVSRQIFQN